MLMRFGVLIIISASYFCSDAQVLYQKRYEANTYYNSFNSLLEISPDRFMLTGFVTEVTNASDGHVMCVDSSGNIIWEKRYNFTGGNYSNNSNIGIAAKNTDHSITIIGRYSTPSDWSNIAVMRIDESGNIIFGLSFGFNFDDYAISNIPTADNGNLVTGYINRQVIDTAFQAVAVKLDASGNIEWAKSYGSSGQSRITDAIEIPGEGYYLYGYTTDFSDTIDYTNPDVFLLKTDLAGDIVSSQMIQTPGGEYSSKFMKTEDGYFRFGLATNAFNSFGATKQVILETDSNLITRWCKRYITDGTGYSNFTFLKTTKDKGMIFYPNPVIKVDSLGNLVWRKNIFSVFNDVVEFQDSTFLFNCNMVNGVGLIKTDASGTPGCYYNLNGIFFSDPVWLDFQSMPYFPANDVIFNIDAGISEAPVSTTVITDCFTAVPTEEILPEHSGLMAYPTLFDELFLLKYTAGDINKLQVIAFTDLQGAQVPFGIKQYSGRLEVRPARISPGVYFLKIVDQNVVKVIKLIKM